MCEMSEINENSINLLFREYDSLCNNIIHVETQLFNHNSFFTTLFLATATASTAILQLISKSEPFASTSSQSSISGQVDTISVSPSIGLFTLSLLFLVLFIIGRFELRIITQLRIRKMKFVESIIRIREFFIERDYPSLASYMLLPSKIEKAPGASHFGK